MELYTQLTFNCSESTIETLEKGVERRQWRRFGVFNINIAYTLQLTLVFLMLTLNN